MNFNELTAHEILDLLKSKKVTATEIYSSVSRAIEKRDPKIKGYVRTKTAFDESEYSGTTLQGIPISIKDNICIKDTPVTCSSHILEGFKPPYDATVIQRLRQAGASIIGQTNMDEFAFGSSTENSYYGPTKNPWDLSCVPGGSSGGSAAVVGGNEAIWSLGSDTGGSIRQPASFCGVVGMKPTYGLVSRFGLIAFASSLDQIGPITKDVRDNALLLSIIAGHDENDSTSANISIPDYTQAFTKDIEGLKIAVPKEYFIKGMEKDVESAIREARETLKKLGATFKEVSLPHTEYAVATYYIVATAEASSNLARFDGVEYGLRAFPEKSRRTPLIDMYEETRDKGFGNEAKRRMMLGTYSLSAGYYDAYYLRGQKVRTLIKNDFDKVFNEFDAVISPTAPTTAFKIGEKASDPLSMYLSDIYTISANLAGIPALSLPCGFSKNNLPVGLQIMSKPFNEEMIYRIAYRYEQSTDWHKRKVSL